MLESHKTCWMTLKWAVMICSFWKMNKFLTSIMHIKIFGGVFMYNVVLYWKAGIVFIETELVIFNVYTRSAKNCGICFQFNEWIHNVVFIIRIIFLLFSRWYCFHWRDLGFIDPLFIRINVQGLFLLLMYVMFILRMSEFFFISRKILLWYQG